MTSEDNETPERETRNRRLKMLGSGTIGIALLLSGIIPLLILVVIVLSLTTDMTLPLVLVAITGLLVLNERGRVWKQYGGIVLLLGLFISFTISYNGTMALVTISLDEPFAVWDVTVLEGFENTMFNDIEFINETHGWLAGSNTHRGILHTNDSGITWTVQYEREGMDFYSISVLDSDNIWAGSDQRLIHSLDGGISWVNVSTIYDFPMVVEFYNASYGWVGSHSELSVTKNGGLTWQWVDWPDVYPGEIIVTPTNVRIATRQGIYLTDDTGITWTIENPKSAYGISFVDDDNIWVAHYDTVTHFDGHTWNEQLGVSRLLNHIRPHIWDIEFIDENKGWVVGVSPAIAYTPDGGRTWYDQLSDEISFHTFDTYDGVHCWAAGWGGRVARTTTGNLFGPKLVRGFYLSLFGPGGRTIPYEPLLVASCLSISFGVVATYMWRKHRTRNEKIVYD